jgi:hypothetical protein
MPHNGEPLQLVGYNNSGRIFGGFKLPRSGLLEPAAGWDAQRPARPTAAPLGGRE